MLYIALDAVTPFDGIPTLPFGDEDGDRLQKIAHAPSRNRSLCARMLLHKLMRRSALEETQAIIRRDRNGRPYFSNIPYADFSLTHTDSLCGAALCCHTAPRVGIDLEEISESRDCERLAHRFFTAEEQQMVREGGNDVFFRLWTQKEAYAKYSGQALTSLLSTCNVARKAQQDGLLLTSLPVAYGAKRFWLSYCATPQENEPIFLTYDQHIQLKSIVFER